MPCPCLADVVPLPCHAAKGSECVFPIWFTQCGRVWFTLAMPCPCHIPTVPFFSRPQHSTTRPSLDCVNQMGKTHSEPLAARHDRGTASARHGHRMVCLNRPLTSWNLLGHSRPVTGLIYLYLQFSTTFPSSIYAQYLITSPTISRGRLKHVAP
jgi:hypothetical protein